MISLDELNAAERTKFVAALGGIFEHAPWVADEVFTRRPFATLASLYATMTDAVEGADAKRQLALIKAHPDLAGKAARAGDITADSKAEQTSAGLDRLSQQDYARFHRLNDAYRMKFGIPFIVCVRRHTKDSILQQFERRLMNEASIELNTALGEVFRIAALRLDQHVSAPDRLKVDGRLSTHVLDTHSGRPAAGVAIELFELSDAGESRLIEQASHQSRWTNRRAADPRAARSRSAAMSCGSRSAIILPSSARRLPIRRSSTWCRCGFPSPSRRATTTSRCWSRPGATPPTAGARACTH